MELVSNDCLKSRMRENRTYGSMRGSRQAFHLKYFERSVEIVYSTGIMIRIAIIDDDIAICKQIYHYLIEYDFAYMTDFKIHSFISCEKMCDSIKSGNMYDLIFLDIEFPQMNGIDLSHYLRIVQRNIKTQIVFVSAKDMYAMELFSAQPFDFIIKPIDSDNVFSVVNRYIDYYHESNILFTYTYENTKHEIAVNSIIYIKSEGKQLLLHTENGNILTYQKFSNVLKQQLRNKFITIRRGIAVNTNHIIMSDYDKIILSDKTEFTISRRLQSYVRKRISYDVGGQK